MTHLNRFLIESTKADNFYLQYVEFSTDFLDESSCKELLSVDADFRMTRKKTGTQNDNKSVSKSGRKCAEERGSL